MAKPIEIVILHSVSETDYGPYEEWRMEGTSSASIRKEHAFDEAQATVQKLQKAGIPAKIVVRTRKISYPRGF